MVASGCAKCLMVFVNVIFTLFGLAILILGVLFRTAWNKVKHAFADEGQTVDINIQNAGETAAYGAIIFGSFILVLSLVGCIGACCRVKCLLGLYAIVVILILIGEVIVVGITVRLATTNREDLANGLRDSLKNYHEDPIDSKSKSFTALFSTMKCCGVEDYTTDFTTDQAGVPFYSSAARDQTKYPPKIPLACCRGVNYESTFDATIFDQNSACLTTPTKENAYVTGCLDSLLNVMNRNKGVLIGIAAAIFFIEILLVILSFVLMCETKGYYRMA